jgi:hypothetical protein
MDSPLSKEPARLPTKNDEIEISQFSRETTFVSPAKTNIDETKVE